MHATLVISLPTHFFLGCQGNLLRVAMGSWALCFVQASCIGTCALLLMGSRVTGDLQTYGGGYICVRGTALGTWDGIIYNLQR